MAIAATNVGGELRIGRPAPSFNLRDHDGRWVSLDELIAHGPIVLAFYPIDFSPVCTKQLCSYRDAYDPIRSLGARVVGISPDSPDRHRQFITAKHLPFPLLSDPDNAVARAYGVVPQWLKIRTRGLFVIDRHGIVRAERIESTMFTHRSADELIAMLRDLEGQS